MMSRKITFVTGNSHKLREVMMILGDAFQDRLVSKDIDLPEFQGEPDDVTRLKCEEALKHISGPVIIEDTCLCYHALGGMPGPYIKWFLKPLGPEGLYKLLHGFEDKSATAICTFAYHDGVEGSKVQLFKGLTEGKIVSPKGEKNFGWDSCFQPTGFTKTYAELIGEEKNKISHRGKALQLLKQYLQSMN